MKCFQKVFSKLEKKSSSNCDQVVQLNDFSPGFLSSMSFADGWETQYFLLRCASNLGIFKGLKSKSGYFYGFPKKSR